MMNRRDLLLQEMQISQWQLTKPQVLKGDAQIRLAQTVKLVVICDEDPTTRRFFHDVRLALGLSQAQCQWLTSEQANRLEIQHSVKIWSILPEQQWVRSCEKYAKYLPWCFPSWEALQQADTKRQFWRQIEPFCQVVSEPFNE